LITLTTFVCMLLVGHALHITAVALGVIPSQSSCLQPPLIAPSDQTFHRA
jgi:hypothetical protein